MKKSSPDSRSKAALLEEIEQFRSRLDEAEQTLDAIRSGEVDALVVSGPHGDQVFSLTGAERTYRLIVETMNEAALTLALDGTILFCNQRFCDLMQTPMVDTIGQKLAAFVAPAQREPLRTLLADVQVGPIQRRLTLRSAVGAAVPVQIAANLLSADNQTSICLVASDLSTLEAQAGSIRVLREQQQALEESRAELQAANASLRDSRLSALNVAEDAIAARRQAEDAIEKLRHEVAERTQAELALRASEEEFRAFFETAAVGTAEFGPDGRLIRANGRLCEITGYDREELLTMTPSDLTHPEDRASEDRKLAAYLRGEQERYQAEKRYLHKDGRPIWVQVTAAMVRDSAGTPLRSAVVIEDITARKTAEESLNKWNAELEIRVDERTKELAGSVEQLRLENIQRRNAEEHTQRLNRLYKVLSETNQAIIRTMDMATIFQEFCRIATEDANFKLAWVGLVSDQSHKLQIVAAKGEIGYLEDIEIATDEEPLGLGPTGITVREGTDYICNDFLGSPVTHPWHDRGRAHGIGASASIALRQEGTVIGALTLYADQKDFFDTQQVDLLHQMGADVSFALDNIAREKHRRDAEQSLKEETFERLRTTEALREKEQMLIQQSRLAAMGEMIGNIAHQWRQPLNTLGMAVQQLLLYFDMGEFSRKLLEQNVNISRELIQHMSTTIDDFRNYFRPDKEKVEFKVAAAVNRTLSLVRDGFRDQNIEIELVVESDPVIFGYQNEYPQVLLNILINAKDALLERNVKHPKVTITIGAESGKAVVTVSDNAGGIPDEIKGKIFDPYFTTKGPQLGTGIGLFMSKSIIEKNMGGKLSVRNTADGAEFRIEVKQ